MPTKQSNSRNNSRIMRICRYGVFAALCIVFGYIESLIPLTIIAPGVKLGLSNAIALMLISLGDTKGAFAVNIARIILSALLFGSPFSLLFSLCAGLGSLIVSASLYRTGRFSIIGLGIAGGAAHNLIQLAVAMFIVGRGVIYYLPLLLIFGLLSGALVSIPSGIISKRMKKII